MALFLHWPGYQDVRVSAIEERQLGRWHFDISIEKIFTTALLGVEAGMYVQGINICTNEDDKTMEWKGERL